MSKAIRQGLPIGWQGLRYPGGDPENGPAYLQRWTGEQFICVEHKWVRDQPDEDEVCDRCYAYKSGVIQ